MIWRDNPIQIVEKYLAWADDYQENQITILYDTMWNGTRQMAEHLARGVHEAEPEVEIKLYNVSKSDKNDVITEIFKSKAIAVGSPTINRGILTSIAGILEEIRGLGFKGKKAVPFGTYRWSGESVKMLHENLRHAGFAVIDDGIRVLWNPDDEGLEQCIEYGKQFAKNA